MDLFGPEPVTIWYIVRHWAGRPLLTKLLKEHGKDKVKEAALKTLKDDAVEQLPYMLEILKDGAAGTPIWKLPDDALIKLAVAKGVPTRGKTRQELINSLSGPATMPAT
jgi:hypothetical protein